MPDALATPRRVLVWLAGFLAGWLASWLACWLTGLLACSPRLCLDPTKQKYERFMKSRRSGKQANMSIFEPGLC
jgi:hypothetical protein